MSDISGRNVTVRIVLHSRQLPYLHHSSTSFDHETDRLVTSHRSNESSDCEMVSSNATGGRGLCHSFKNELFKDKKGGNLSTADPQ